MSAVTNCSVREHKCVVDGRGGMVSVPRVAVALRKIPSPNCALPSSGAKFRDETARHYQLTNCSVGGLTVRDNRPRALAS